MRESSTTSSSYSIDLKFLEVTHLNSISGANIAPVFWTPPSGEDGSSWFLTCTRDVISSRVISMNNANYVNMLSDDIQEEDLKKRPFSDGTNIGFKSGIEKEWLPNPIALFSRNIFSTVNFFGLGTIGSINRQSVSDPPYRLCVDGPRWPPGNAARAPPFTVSEWRQQICFKNDHTPHLTLPCAPEEWRPYRGLFGYRNMENFNSSKNSSLVNWVKHNFEYRKYEAALRLIFLMNIMNKSNELKKLFQQLKTWNTDEYVEQNYKELIEENQILFTKELLTGGSEGKIHNLLTESPQNLAPGFGVYPVREPQTRTIEFLQVEHILLNQTHLQLASMTNTSILLIFNGRFKSNIFIDKLNLNDDPEQLLESFDYFSNCNPDYKDKSDCGDRQQQPSQQFMKGSISINLTDLLLEFCTTERIGLFRGYRSGQTEGEGFESIGDPKLNLLSWLSFGELGLDLELEKTSNDRNKYIPYRKSCSLRSNCQFFEIDDNNDSELTELKYQTGFVKLWFLFRCGGTSNLNVKSINCFKHSDNLALIITSYETFVVIWSVVINDDKLNCFNNNNNNSFDLHLNSIIFTHSEVGKVEVIDEETMFLTYRKNASSVVINYKVSVDSCKAKKTDTIIQRIEKHIANEILNIQRSPKFPFINVFGCKKKNSGRN